MGMGVVSISEMTSLAFHAMILLAKHEKDRMNVKRMAFELAASEAHLAKTLQKLAKAGFVNSVRGPKGGFALAKPKGEVTLFEIYELFEGRHNAADDCPLYRKKCPLRRCPFNSLFKRIDAELREEFTRVTLDDVN